MCLVHPEIQSKLHELQQFAEMMAFPDIPMSANVRGVLNAKLNELSDEIRKLACHLQKKPKKQVVPKEIEEKPEEL